MANNLDKINFRELVYKFLLIKNLDTKNRLVIEYAGYHLRQDDNAFLVYGYIDPDAGITFEFMCAACVFEDGKVALEPGDETKAFKIRYGSFQGEVIPFQHEDRLPPYYLKRALSIQSAYKTREDVMQLRSFRELDNLRAPGFPDDIVVLFAKEGYRNEGIWCRIIGIASKEQEAIVTIKAMMLNEPDAPFGKHEGDIVDIAFDQTEAGETIAFAVM